VADAGSGRQSDAWRTSLEVFTMLMRAAVIIALCTVSTAMSQLRSAAPQLAETYESATVDRNGHLTIVKTGGQIVLVRKEGEQTAFSAPVISPARTAVATQAMFGNCCTSYDIPLQLVVYAGGKTHRFTGVGWPIFQWGFADGGTRIAYGQEPVHFSCVTHYELRDIESERLIDAVDVPQPCGQTPDPRPVKMPDWVASLVSRK
jgi:hypothetical protein